MHNNHVEALKTKHRKLENAIHEEMQRPSINEMHIADLKKEKLFIKEQIDNFN